MHEKETILDKIGRVISVAGNGILMNLLFLVSCIPVVTIGQAFSALLTAIRYQIRGDRWIDGYKAGFKRRWLRGSIAWCIMLAVDIYFLLDVRHAYFAAQTNSGATAPFIAACVMFALAAMVTIALQLLNVYVPTPVGDWVRNAVNMVFKVPFELLVAAGLYWLPAVLFLLWDQAFAYFLMIFVAAYYTIAALCITLLMKNALVRYLLQARTDGTLLAEEGANAAQKEEE